MLTPEAPLSPEIVKGSPFRVPVFDISSDGTGFIINHLNVPTGWTPSIGNDYQSLATSIHKTWFFNPGAVVVDSYPQTGLITCVSMKGDANSPKIELDLSLDKIASGTYVAKHITDLEHLAFLFHIIGFCSSGFSETTTPSIGLGRTYGREFYPDNLELPLALKKISAVATTPEYRRLFTMRSDEIAHKFKEKVWSFTFNEQGVLTYVELESKNGRNDRTGYGLQYNNFWGQNHVERIEPAVVLHNIVATYTNDMLDLLENQAV